MYRKITDEDLKNLPLECWYLNKADTKYFKRTIITVKHREYCFMDEAGNLHINDASFIGANYFIKEKPKKLYAYERGEAVIFRSEGSRQEVRLKDNIYGRSPEYDLTFQGDGKDGAII